VHRALQRLGELDLIGKVVLPGADAVAYEIAAGDHAHFHCRHCGRILDLDYTLPSSTLTTLATHHHVEVQSATLTLTGTCAACVETP
jgi:Fe2+ or Zn2+ uptake regulation protein